MTVTLLILLCPLLALSAVFSGSETALFSLTHADRVRLRRDRPGIAHAVTALLAGPKRLLLTILMLNTAVNVTYFVVSTVLVGRIEAPTLAAGFSIASLLVIILFGEVLAKLIASSHRVAWCALFAKPMLIVQGAISPIRSAIDRFALSPLARLVAPGSPTPVALTAAELDSLLYQSAGQGDIDASEQNLLAAVVWLGQSRVRDAMTHRTEVVWLSQDATVEQARSVIAQVRRSRIPVKDASAEGAVLGQLNAPRYLAAIESRPARANPPKLLQYLEPVEFLPDSATLDKALEHFRRTGTNIAICVDEHGSVTGLIEIEDAVERLLPIAADPDDDLRQEISQLGPGRWSVPARLRAHEWMQEIFGPGGTARDSRVTTLGGLVLASLGRVAQTGDSIQIAGVNLEVESTEGLAIGRLIVSMESSAGQGGAA